MGADFLYALAPMYRVTPERLSELRVAIYDIPAQTLREYDDAYCLFGTDNSIEQREMLTAACLFLGEQYEGTCRDTAILKTHGMDWRAVITGGLSWGDSPTDSFETINMVATVEEVFELLKRWSTEDERE